MKYSLKQLRADAARDGEILVVTYYPNMSAVERVGDLAHVGDLVRIERVQYQVLQTRRGKFFVKRGAKKVLK